MPNRERIEQQILDRSNPSVWGETCILPDYNGYCIAGLAGWIEQLFCHQASGSPLSNLTEDLPPFEHVLLLVLDGLGYRKLQSLFERVPESTLSTLARDGLFLPLTSVFPSTTVAALASIATGQTPLEHGLIGYRLYLRETSAITNMIRYSMVGNGRGEAAFHAGLDLETILAGPTAQERLTQQGIETHTILPQHIAGSGLSRTLYRGSTHVHQTVGLADMLVTARETLARATSRSFLSLYWPGLDTVAHVRGPHTEAYFAEWRVIDDALRRELVGRAGKTLLLLTADHGFVPMNPEDYIRLPAASDADGDLLLPPVGEPRASYLYVRHGAKERVARALAGASSDDGLVCVDSRTLIDDRLLGIGTPHPEIPRRLGDLAVVSTGRAGVFHPYQDAVLLRGMHGGLTEQEMLVPLIACSL